MPAIISSEMEALATQTKTTNFSIAAIMSGLAEEHGPSVKKRRMSAVEIMPAQIKTEPEDLSGASDNVEMNTSSSSSGSSSSSNVNVNNNSIHNNNNNAAAPSGEERLPTTKKERRPRVVEECNAPELEGVRCQLDNKELWDKFCEFGTEMIITRTGRRMFPTVRVTFSNLESLLQHHEPAGTKYLVLLDIVPCDNKRYRYAYHRSAWLVAGKADPAPPHRIHPHPDGPFTLEQLRKQVIGFEKVKITNNETDNSGQLILNSMHKFQPRVYLVRRKDGNPGPVVDIEKEDYRTFVFPETQFTAVTAYQNQCITKLKIESNPFAKGFRDSAGSDFDDHHSPYGPAGAFGGSPLPGGMPGMDPFSRMHHPHPYAGHHQHPAVAAAAVAEANNNFYLAAEKARFMLLYPGAAAAAAAVAANAGRHLPPTSSHHPPGLLPPIPSPGSGSIPPHTSVPSVSLPPPALAAAAAAVTTAGGPGFPSLPTPPALGSPAGPAPSGYPLPLPPELLARYSAIQASLSLYNPALLQAAAALRNSAAVAATTCTTTTSSGSVPPMTAANLSPSAASPSSSSSHPPSSLNSSLSSPRSPELPSPRTPHQRFSPYVIARPGGQESPAPSSSPLSEDRPVSPPPAQNFPALLR